MLKETMRKRVSQRMHMLRKTIMRVSILHRSMEEIMLKTVIRRIHMIRKAIMKASILQRSMLREATLKRPTQKISTPRKAMRKTNITRASIQQRSMLRVMFKTLIPRMSTTKTMPEVSERAALKVRTTPRMMQVKMI